MNIENENDEFKVQATDRICKEVIAFANSDGGIRYIGIEDAEETEDMRSLEQQLTFEKAKDTFQQYHVDFSEAKYRTLGIINPEDATYTNLALLLSDQCQHTTKIAVFADESNTKFKDSKEFGGSVFKQLEDSFSYLMLCNHHPAELKGLMRIEHPDYPEEALREALLNAIVHRDYSFSGSIIINVNDKEMEFISIGGLLPGLSPDDIRSGISQPRNRKLAEVFHRLRLIESYGTGIRRIYSFYAESAVQPRIEITPNTFKIVLPNLNTNKVNTDVSEQEQLILDYISENGTITDQEIQELLNVKLTRTYAIVKTMREKGLIRQQGRGSEKKYLL